MPGTSQGESQARSPGAVKTRLSRTTRVRDFSISAFPQGSLWSERPPEWGDSPRAATRAGEPSHTPYERLKKGGRSLHQHPLWCGACNAPDTGGHARRSLAKLYRSGRGKSVNPASNAEFRGSPQPQRGGLCPLRVERWGCQHHAPPPRATPHFSVARPYDGICVTPQGGNNRSIRCRSRPPVPGRIG